MSRQKPTSPSRTDLLPLLEFSSVVNSSLDLRFILGTVLLTLMGKLLVGKGVVLLRKEKKIFHIENGKGIPKDLLHTDIEFPRVMNKSFTSHTAGESFQNILTERGITRFFPIISQKTILGYFGIAERATHNLTKEEKRFVETLINISAAAIEKGLTFDELQSANRALDGKIQELKTLFELGKGFSGILEREKLLKLFSLTLMGQVGTSRYAMCLRDGTSVYSRIDGSMLEIDKKMVCDLVEVPMRVESIPRQKKYVRLREYVEAQKIAALIPLQIQNEVKGVLCLGERMRGGTYTQSDLEFIYSLANLAFISLENVRLFEEAVEKQRLENELMIAKEIQQGLLPRALPDIHNYEIASLNISSKQVGGDYYDVLPTPDGNYIFVIADVSGKGTPASLLMANLQATVHALVPINFSLSEATSRINDLIYRNTASDKFITFFWGALDPLKNIFTYVNAGHNQPIVLRSNGSIERLDQGGLILGIMKTIVPYTEGSVHLQSGDAIIMYTDGVSEAMNIKGIDYSEERLEQFVKYLNKKTAGSILEEIRSEIQSYTAGAPQSDDITLVIITAK
ncbi:MAG: PP2C family protein-serine/threonine phosphatase [Bacteroidota bacterium]